MNQSSIVPSLTAQEVDDLLAGRGLGMARAAELNGYPGPRHVLDLSEALDLDAKTLDQTRQIFEEMQAAAQPLGTRIVDAEKQLGESFASGTPDESSVQEKVAALADLTSQLRVIHLRAHLRMRELLTPAQIARYRELRGYAAKQVQATPGAGTPGAHRHGS
jgi:Spy/CpxP family protein refolding chaperone